MKANVTVIVFLDELTLTALGLSRHLSLLTTMALTVRFQTILLSDECLPDLRGSDIVGSRLITDN